MLLILDAFLESKWSPKSHRNLRRKTEAETWARKLQGSNFGGVGGVGAAIAKKQKTQLHMPEAAAPVGEASAAFSEVLPAVLKVVTDLQANQPVGPSVRRSCAPIIHSTCTIIFKEKDYVLYDAVVLRSSPLSCFHTTVADLLMVGTRQAIER